jgi:hypothetical protein
MRPLGAKGLKAENQRTRCGDRPPTALRQPRTPSSRSPQCGQESCSTTSIALGSLQPALSVSHRPVSSVVWGDLWPWGASYEIPATRIRVHGRCGPLSRTWGCRKRRYLPDAVERSEKLLPCVESPVVPTDHILFRATTRTCAKPPFCLRTQSVRSEQESPLTQEPCSPSR